MNIRNSILAVSVGAVLTFSSACVFGAGSPQKDKPAAAKHQETTPSSKKAVTTVSRGKITSIDQKMLVLSRKKNGKDEQVKLVLNPETVRKGDLAVGTQVTVHYRTEDSQQIATSIQASPEKSAATDTKKNSTK